MPKEGTRKGVMKKSKMLLVSWVLGAVYLVYIIAYVTGAVGETSGSEQAGAVLAATLLTPHMIAVGIAVLFNILGWAMNRRGFALTGGILYAVAIVLFPVYFFFVIIQMILSFIGYAKMKKVTTAS